VNVLFVSGGHASTSSDTSALLRQQPAASISHQTLSVTSSWSWQFHRADHSAE